MEVEEGAAINYSSSSSSSSSSDPKTQTLVEELRTHSRLHWNYLHLHALPPELVEEGERVEEIHLKCNALTTLPHNFGCLTRLTCCYLSSNKLHSLPESIGDLKALTVLDVGNNNLRSLPSSLGSLPGLRSLVAVHNKLTAFPQELCSIHSLSMVMLSGNRLRALPPAVRGLRGLMGLYVDHNMLSELPLTLAELPMLTRVSCCSNLLSFLPARLFVSRPRIYYDNNSINYLPFAMVRQLMVGQSWEPLVLPTFSCIPKDVIVNNAVRLNTSGQAHPSALVLPKQIKTASIYIPGNKTVAPLKELCLRSLHDLSSGFGRKYYADGDWKSSLLDQDPNALPRVLLEALEDGPIALCDFPECQKAIFMHAVILVVSIDVTPREGLEVVKSPVLLYLCSSQCGDRLEKYGGGGGGGGMWRWLAERIRTRMSVDEC